MTRLKKSEVEDSMLSVKNSSSLTGDLPGQNKKPRGIFSRNLIPAIIIILVGVATFVGTTLYQSKNSDSLGGNNNEDWLQQNVNNSGTSTNEVVEEEPIYETKSFAIVKPNESNFLNVRKEGAPTGEKLGQLDIGDKLELLQEQAEWVQVKLNTPLSGATTGWVAKSYVEITTENVQIN